MARGSALARQRVAQTARVPADVCSIASRSLIGSVIHFRLWPVATCRCAPSMSAGRVILVGRIGISYYRPQSWSRTKRG